jgi:hypothetical protein
MTDAKHDGVSMGLAEAVLDIIHIGADAGRPARGQPGENEPHHDEEMARINPWPTPRASGTN